MKDKNNKTTKRNTTQHRKLEKNEQHRLDKPGMNAGAREMMR
jgi:hypothetical protein